MNKYEIKAKEISNKYGEKILNLLYEKPGIIASNLCEELNLSPPGLWAIMNKMKSAHLVYEKSCGKYKFYFLPAEVKRAFTQPKVSIELNQSLFLNILKWNKGKPYVSYFLKDIAYTLDFFPGEELIMLLYILKICSYEEGQSFSTLFNFSDLEAIRVKKDLLYKFKEFLFHIVGKGDFIGLDEEKRRI